MSSRIQDEIQRATSRSDDPLRQTELQARIQELRRTDNVTNWLYLGREYLYLGSVLGATLYFLQRRAQWEISWLWTLLVVATAILLVGVGQHRLVMLAHEASHSLLFHNPVLNEISSNWLCLYPMWSMTYNYRLQHLAHHQYTNDPERDPDLIYMRASGHHFYHPMTRGEFVWNCVVKPLLWVPGLLHYIAIRARFANLGGVTAPYQPVRKPSNGIPAVHLGYLFVPHYHLPALDDLLRETQIYRGQAVIIQGFTRSHGAQDDKI
jgi:hypothetical protein